MKCKSYYAQPIPEEQLRPFALELAHWGGQSYQTALTALRAVTADNDTMPLPRYMNTISGRHVRLWGKNIIHNGRKP